MWQCLFGRCVETAEKSSYAGINANPCDEPLGDEVASKLLPTDTCIEDVRYILDYYRLSADKRLLFGGGTVYGGTDPADIVGKLRPNMLKIFPELAQTKIDYAWSGNFALSFSRVPQLAD